MKFDTKTTQAEGATKSLHPEGKWDAKVLDAEHKKAKSGRDMLEVLWKTSKGKVKSWHCYVDDYPYFFLDPMYALGLDAEYFEAGPEWEDIANELEGRRAMIEIVHGEYQGRPTANVETVHPVPDSGIK